MESEPNSVNGIEVKMAIIDYGDRNEEGEPVYTEMSQRFTEHELARSDNRSLFDSVMEQVTDKLIHEWRSDDD